MAYARVDTQSGTASATAFYGESWHQSLDVYVGTGTVPTGGLPCMIYVHGGAWNRGRKEQFILDDIFIGTGSFGSPATFGIGVDETSFPIAACALNYRMNTYNSTGPEQDIQGEPMGLPTYAPDNVIDTMNGVQWLIDNAATYNINPNKIILYGDSAGSVHVCVGAYGAPMPFGLNEMPHEMARYKFDSPQQVLGILNSQGIGDATLAADIQNMFGSASMLELSQSQLRAASPKHLIDVYGKHIPMVMVYPNAPANPVVPPITIHDGDNAEALIEALSAKGIPYSTHYDTVTGSTSASKALAWDDCKEIWNGTFSENT